MVEEVGASPREARRRPRRGRRGPSRPLPPRPSARILAIPCVEETVRVRAGLPDSSSGPRRPRRAGRGRASAERPPPASSVPRRRAKQRAAPRVAGRPRGLDVVEDGVAVAVDRDRGRRAGRSPRSPPSSRAPCASGCRSGRSAVSRVSVERLLVRPGERQDVARSGRRGRRRGRARSRRSATPKRLAGPAGDAPRGGPAPPPTRAPASPRPIGEDALVEDRRREDRVGAPLADRRREVRELSGAARGDDRDVVPRAGRPAASRGRSPPASRPRRRR